MESKAFYDSSTKRTRSTFHLETFSFTKSPSLILSVLAFSLASYYVLGTSSPSTLLSSDPLASAHFAQSLNSCRAIHIPAGPKDPENWANERTRSERFVEGTKPVLIRNAKIWTGTKGDDGEWKIIEKGDVFVDGGVVRWVGKNGEFQMNEELDGLEIINASGKFLTPGLFDVHSHIGLMPLPILEGSLDGNSWTSPLTPQLRSLDGFDSTYEIAFRRTVAGGVTTSLVLPGSLNNIGGQAFVFKLRPTDAHTPSSMLLEPPHSLGDPSFPYHYHSNSTNLGPPHLPWRHMKMACGENIKNGYGITRMDESWNWRKTFEKARKVMRDQDEYCLKAEVAEKEGKVLTEKFPEAELEVEAIVDVLRGRVKVNTHCYEATDFDAFIRITQEFQFPVAAFHHAHEAYLVPSRLNQTYGGTPAIAMFATNARYKREAYLGSPFAGKILEESGVRVVMKSDHDVMDSRYLLFEAQQGRHFGISEGNALASVITNSAEVAGFGHRLGKVKKGYDADLVIWDSHPLTLGATPTHVFIDGILQFSSYPAKSSTEETSLSSPNSAEYSESFQNNFYGYVDPQTFADTEKVEIVAFKGVKELWVRDYENGGVKEIVGENKKLLDPNNTSGETWEVVVKNGKLECLSSDCISASYAQSEGLKILDLKGGSLIPPITCYGPKLGLREIVPEDSTSDGQILDPYFSSPSTLPSLLSSLPPIRAVDGLQFQGKDTIAAHKFGVSRAVTAPISDGFFGGVSVWFRTGAKDGDEKGAVGKEQVAVHLSLRKGYGGGASTSTKVAALRELLTKGVDAAMKVELGEYKKRREGIWEKVVRGDMPLVIKVDSADTMITLVKLKREIEGLVRIESEELGRPIGRKIKMIFESAKESHLLLDQIVKEDIGVILTSPRPLPELWDARRAIDGPPLSKESLAQSLAFKEAKLAIGVVEEWQCPQLFWEAAWIGRLDRAFAVELVTVSLEDMLGLEDIEGEFNFVAYEGDPFEFGSKVVAIGEGNTVNVF